MTRAELLDLLWRDYAASTPQAARIHELLTQRGELLCNDHIALVTFGGAPGIGTEAMARPFEALGWRPCDRYRVRNEHLRARYWRHDDDALPKIVIHEVLADELSAPSRAIIARLVAQLPDDFGERSPLPLPLAGRPWALAHADYQTLVAESPPAARLAALGFRADLVAVDIDSLSTFPDLHALAAFLIDHGERLEDRGGVVKGSRAHRLERCATRPDMITVAFSDVTVRIPGSCYEFTRRYPLPSGELFHGFVATSASSPIEAIDAAR